MHHLRNESENKLISFCLRQVNLPLSLISILQPCEDLIHRVFIRVRKCLKTLVEAHMVHFKIFEADQVYEVKKLSVLLVQLTFQLCSKASRLD